MSLNLRSKKIEMGFFESDIVQEEAKKLFTDYQELMKLGSDYGKFDREGKKMFIKKISNERKIDPFSLQPLSLNFWRTNQYIHNLSLIHI